MSDVSPPPFHLRLIVEDAPRSGAWNMSVDAVLLESALQNGICTLRWYAWEEPTLSLGYFQSPNDSLIDQRFADLPVVRRLSGGGAILHDRELTYSCALCPEHPLAKDPSSLYSSIHAAIVATLQTHGIEIAARGENDRGLDSNFLCFSRGDANDLVIRGHKVLGSAQRRRRGAVLQHGALLLERSPLAREYPGITDLTGVAIAPEIRAQLVKRSAAVIGRWIEPGILTQEEAEVATRLARQPLTSRVTSSAK